MGLGELCDPAPRVYGKPGQAVEVSGQTTGPSRILLISPDMSKLSDAALAEIVALSDDAQADP